MTGEYCVGELQLYISNKVENNVNHSVIFIHKTLYWKINEDYIYVWPTGHIAKLFIFEMILEVFRAFQNHINPADTSTENYSGAHTQLST